MQRRLRRWLRLRPRRPRRRRQRRRRRRRHRRRLPFLPFLEGKRLGGESSSRGDGSGVSVIILWFGRSGGSSICGGGSRCSSVPASFGFGLLGCRSVVVAAATAAVSRFCLGIVLLSSLMLLLLLLLLLPLHRGLRSSFGALIFVIVGGIIIIIIVVVVAIFFAFFLAFFRLRSSFFSAPASARALRCGNRGRVRVRGGLLALDLEDKVSQGVSHLAPKDSGDVDPGEKT
jgi:hypothetical protein